MSEFWKTKRVLVAGGKGFLGSSVVERLQREGCAACFAPSRQEADLRSADAVDRLYRESRPQIVLHLAGVVGGIQANTAHPGRFFYDNMQMGLNLIEQARHHGLEKFVLLSSACAYPKLAPVPFREEEIWNGYPEETNAPYAVAKRALMEQLKAYRQEYGFPGIALIPGNLYGPRDHFDPQTSHVVPALIRRCVEARESGQKEIVLWGDGSPTREFLYVEDCAEAILLAAERYQKPEPVNVGTGSETSIRELVGLMAELTRFTGRITWDSSKPGGQPRRRLDTSRASREFGFRAKTPLREGLEKTIAWYESNRFAHSL